MAWLRTTYWHSPQEHPQTNQTLKGTMAWLRTTYWHSPQEHPQTNQTLKGDNGMAADNVLVFTARASSNQSDT